MKSRPNLHEILALIMIAIGAFGSSFIMLRENRIEKGNIYTLNAAAGDYWLPVAALLILIACLTVAPYVKRLNFLFGQTIYARFKTILIAISIPILIVLTGSMASDMLEGQPSPTRVSLGIGFWLVLIALYLLFVQSLKQYNCGKVESLLLTTLIIGMVVVIFVSGGLSDLSLVKEYENKASRIQAEMWMHMKLATSATLTGLLLSMFLAKQAYQYPKARGFVMSIVNMAQVIPTLTFLGLVMIPLTQLVIVFPVLKQFGVSGIGFVPAYIVLTFYALLPMSLNILAGYNSIDISIIEAAIGMGMTKGQLHRKIMFPLIIPYIYTGFSIALVQTVANTILAGLVGGGGIGSILFLGLAQSAPDLVILSALLIVSVALILKFILDSMEPIFTGFMQGGYND